jgi:hypothetical protein
MRGFAELQKHEIVHLRQRFDDDTPDPVWISTLANERNWIIISADVRITRSPVERAAWIESGLTAFFFAQPFPGDGFWKQAQALVTWWPDIILQARKTPERHGFLIQKKAKELRQLYP